MTDFAERIVYVRWVQHPRSLTIAEQIAIVTETGCSHDGWSVLVECDEHGTPLAATGDEKAVDIHT